MDPTVTSRPRTLHRQRRRAERVLLHPCLRPAGKILVIRGGAIGDFILTLPVLAALRERFPDVHRELLGYPRVADLALAAGLVDRVQSIDARPMASFFARGGPLPEQLWPNTFQGLPGF